MSLYRTHSIRIVVSFKIWLVTKTNDDIVTSNHVLLLLMYE
jgi:hypothetical protein